MPSATSKAFSEFMTQHKYIDPWRFNNPLAREYSFFSHVHHTFSRIDYFFVDGSLFPKVTNTKYLPIVISDHTPLVLDIVLNSHRLDRPPWRLNSLLLSDPSFCELISSSIDTFLRINKTPNTSYSLLWDTLRAYLRGYIISYASHQNKIRKAKQMDLSNAILNIDRQYTLNHLLSSINNALTFRQSLTSCQQGQQRGYISLVALTTNMAIKPVAF